jgi:hypothetical protein
MSVEMIDVAVDGWLMATRMTVWMAFACSIAHDLREYILESHHFHSGKSESRAR